MLSKIVRIAWESLPILVMVGLIPFVTDDYVLSAVFIILIGVLLHLKKEHGDYLVLGIGFVAMILFESLFVSTGVEVFTRISLFGLMPVWLPILWAYAFIVMKRSLKILGHHP